MCESGSTGLELDPMIPFPNSIAACIGGIRYDTANANLPSGGMVACSTSIATV